MEARIFTGRRTVEGAEVLADGQPLDLAPSLRLRRHSPTGFEWGYGGSGPSQLALALLLASGVGEPDALAVYQAFKLEVVAGLPGSWEMPAEGIRKWVEEALRADRRTGTDGPVSPSVTRIGAANG